jgi:hypothetical protein
MVRLKWVRRTISPYWLGGVLDYGNETALGSSARKPTWKRQEHFVATRQSLAPVHCTHVAPALKRVLFFVGKYGPSGRFSGSPKRIVE